MRMEKRVAQIEQQLKEEADKKSQEALAKMRKPIKRLTEEQYDKKYGICFVPER